jgi:DHA1 family bicyclomycin/chloramphenicol resistance-like MFS transporter
MALPPIPTADIGRRELVAFVAAVMAVNALGVDLMLPALPAIGRQLDVVDNARQWIVTIYVLGFGLGQLVYGPLADRLGRKPVLLVTLVGFAVAALVAAHARTFEGLLAARLMQGLMSASTRVLAVTIIRDRYHGRQMARVSSLAQMIFFLVPIMAPSLGQALLGLGPWPVIFYALGSFASLVFAWTLLRLPETLARERRREISIASLIEAYGQTITDRYSIGYAMAASLTFGGIIAFVSSAQQVFTDTFHQGGRFTILFGLCALSMGGAAFANSRLVERLGTRMISQAGLLTLIALALVHTAVIESGAETLPSYMVLQALSLACIGLCGSNFGAMAMEPVGHIAGTASSLQGFVTSVGAVIVGSLIGQAYDGTTLPLAVGYVGIGLVALGIVAVIERGQFFRARMA